MMTVTYQEGLSGKRSFINRSLTGVGRSGSCLPSDVLMASPTPCILPSSFAFPFQKNVYPPFGSTIEPSWANLALLRAAMSIWYLPGSLAMRTVLLSGLKEASRSRMVSTFHALKIVFLFLLILTTFKGKRFIVGGAVHRDPTLSAAGARIQWYGEQSQLGTSLAAVDGHDVCSALPCPLCCGWPRRL